jgi:hypothetical protein
VNLLAQEKNKCNSKAQIYEVKQAFTNFAVSEKKETS